MSGPVVTVLIGAAGAGKSTAAARHWPPGQILSLDALRGMAAGDPCDQEATAEAVAVLALLLRARLLRRLPTVVDATHADRSDRAAILDAAAENSVTAAAVVLDVPLAVCLARNAARPGPPPGTRWGRRVPEAVVREQHARIQAALPGLHAEGFTEVSIWPGGMPGPPNQGRGGHG